MEKTEKLLHFANTYYITSKQENTDLVALGTFTGCDTFEEFLFACFIFICCLTTPLKVFVQFRNSQAIFQNHAPEVVTCMGW